MAVQRAADDHESGGKRGLIYRPDKAHLVINYCRHCRHSVGKWRGQPFEHSPWQAFITGELFGWHLQETGFRRYTNALILVGKKNGKSTYLSALGTYMFHGDGENAAQVYALATKKDQARIVFDEAKRMVLASPRLRKEIQVLSQNMHINSTFSKFEPLASDVDTVDGFNPSCQLVDELHRHKSRYLMDLIENADIVRDQPMTIAISTAGDDISGICYEQYLYSMNLLERTYENDQYFAYIVAPDPDYDWRDESYWPYVVPSLGDTITMESMRKIAKKAKQSPASALAFRRYQMNEWVNEVGRWIDMDMWRACEKKADVDELLGQECYGGIDLAPSRDMSAVALLFVLPDDYWYFYLNYYCCQKSIFQRSKNDHVPYDVWLDQGFLTGTEGNVTDFDHIEKDILGMGERFVLQSMGYDPYLATQMANSLQEKGIHMVEVRQGALTLNEPMDLFERKLLEGKIIHNDHPILSWNAQNLVARTNVNLGKAPDKDKSVERIDGMSAALMAIARFIGETRGQEQPKTSIYEERMPLVVGG